MTSRDLNPDKDMIDQVMESIRSTETREDYGYQQMGRGTDGTPEPLVGAYAIPLSRWVGLAGAAGLPDADWRDPAAQDRVVRATLETILEQLQTPDSIRSSALTSGTDSLTSLLAAGFKYGTKVAKYLVSSGRTTPEEISQVPGLDAVGAYVKTYADSGEARTYSADKQAYMQYGGDNLPASGKGDETLTRAQNRIRESLEMIRSSQTSVSDEAIPTAVSDGEGIPSEVVDVPPSKAEAKPLIQEQRSTFDESATAV